MHMNTRFLILLFFSLTVAVHFFTTTSVLAEEEVAETVPPAKECIVEEEDKKDCRPDIKDNYARMIACLQPDPKEDDKEKKSEWSCKTDLEKKRAIMQDINDRVYVDRENAKQWLSDAQKAAEGAAPNSEAAVLLKQAKEKFATADSAYKAYQAALKEGDLVQMYNEAWNINTATNEASFMTDVLEGGASKVEGSALVSKINYGINTSPTMKPLLEATGKQSSLTKAYASEHMDDLLSGPYQQLQARLNKPLVINDAIAKSGTGRESSTKNSEHFHGNALDISTVGMTNAEKLELVAAAKEVGFQGYGFGENILHLDVGSKRAWSYGNTTYGGMNVSTLIDNINESSITQPNMANVVLPTSNIPIPTSSQYSSIMLASTETQRGEIIDSGNNQAAIEYANAQTQNIVKSALSIPSDNAASAEAHKNALQAIEKSYDITQTTDVVTVASISSEMQSLGNDTQKLAEVSGSSGTSVRFTNTDCTSACNNNVGLRQNNPANIEFNSAQMASDPWIGASGDKNGRFLEFETPELGMRAIYEDVETKMQRGADTIREIVQLWTDSGEHTTAEITNKLNTISQTMGINIDTSFDIADPRLGPAFVKGLIATEVGSGFYSDQQILDGYKLAFNFDDTDVAGIKSAAAKIVGGNSNNTGIVISTGDTRGGAGNISISADSNGVVSISTSGIDSSTIANTLSSALNSDSNTPSYGTSGILNKVMDGLMSTLNDALAGTLSKALGGVIENVAPQLTDLTNPSNGSGNCGAGKPNNYIRMWSCLQAGSTGIDPFINTLKTVAGQIVKDAITNLIGKLSPALSGPLNTLSGIASRTGGSLGDFMGAIGGGSQNNSTQSTGNPLADTNFTQTATNSDTSYKKVTPPDLSATALKTESTITNEYRFRGSINKKNESNTAVFTTEELSQFAGCSIQNKLSLDLDCNGSVDATKDFGIPYQSIMPRADGTEVLLSEYMEVPKLGLHCFAFTIDMNDDIEESNENNNMSAWRPFITGFGQDITESATDATLPIFTLEAAGYTSEGTLSSNWTSNALSISDDEELAIRWNAPAYDSCLPFIAPVSYDFVDNIAPNARNTRTENIDLRERTGTYAVQCSKDGEVRVEVIDVEVR